MGVDWIRMTGPESLRRECVAWMEKHFGTEYQERTGVLFFRHCALWANKARVQWGHKSGANESDKCMVELPGSVLALTYDAEERIKILQELRDLGMEGSRIDIAVDVVGLECDLYGKMLASCDAGELCGARTYRPTREIGQGRRIKGRTLYIGLRGGDGSGRMVRCYDKGLETGECEQEGEWERWEAEFTGEVAEKVARVLAESRDWVTDAFRLAVGACDFREVRANRSTTGDRARPRCAWWATLLAMLKPRTEYAGRQTSTLASYAKWIETSVAPTLKFMASLNPGDTVDDVIRWLIRQPDLPSRLEHNEVTELYARERGSRVDVEGATLVGARIGRDFEKARRARELAAMMQTT